MGSYTDVTDWGSPIQLNRRDYELSQLFAGDEGILVQSKFCVKGRWYDIS